MGGFDPPIPVDDGAGNSYSEVREELNSYKGILEKYGQNILQGKTPWEKFEEEDFLTNAKQYLNEHFGGDAKSMYESLKATNRVETLMSLGLKEKYGDEAVYAAMSEIAEETRVTFDSYRQKIEDIGMPKFAEYFSNLGNTLSKLYEEQPAAYLFADGLLHISEQAKTLSETIENTSKKFEQELEKLESLLETLNERYGILT